MKIAKSILVVFLGLTLSNVLVPMALISTTNAQTKDLNIALQRGYRTGYSDGYMAGYRDTIDSLAKNYSRHADYTKADRAFNRDYGTIEDYRDGYQQGFEAGYNTGFEKRSFESALPSDIKKRGIVPTGSQNNNLIPETNVAVTPVTGTETNYAVSETPANTVQTQNGAIIVIPRDTELMLELQEDLSTDKSREGERFTAKVVSPSEIAGATIEGRVSRIKSPGRIKRRSELQLSFDRILLNDNRWSNFNAILTEVMPIKGDNIKIVNTEGTAVGKSSYKSDGIKIGGATGVGLVAGAVVGGPVGAAVGAGLGAAFGVGAVVIERGKHIRLNRNQQLRIKTAYETQIR
ncbi:MAG: hypothetical protein K1X36_15345 [Pyrinomonadaceae bacterium]|nr:hypothetical protein [Pyrinomonadaceae bacterium]